MLLANLFGHNFKTALEKHFLTKICSKKMTYTYNSLQFPGEMNTSGSKTPTFIPFHTNFDYRSTFLNYYLLITK